MNEILMGIVVIFPIISSIFIPFLPFKKRNHMLIYIEAIVLLTTAMVLYLELNVPELPLTLFRLRDNLSVTLQLDGPGRIFAGMVAFLWPFATLYSFEYMKHEGHEKYFFMFYTITYGVTLGVAEAENIITFYMFFEALSLITLPLVMHTLTREAIHAARTYFYFMTGGAAFGLIGMIFILSYGSTSSFVPGGVFSSSRVGEHMNMLLLVYVLCFFGFSVKAAIFPFSSWLPKAGVAPTPVTALLHAVAVVKTGVFAAIRITYYSFGIEMLRDTWAQDVVMTFAIITIVYGSARALKETHLKRRIAWSTVSNLSYILFSVTLMSPAGLEGALSHMVSHAFMKICAFLCAGAIIYKTGREYIHELDGFGRMMPGVFLAFTASGLALMGVPGLCGFVSKWNIMKAAVASYNPLAYVGVGALMISAFLSALYMLTISIRAFFPGKEFDYSRIQDVKDPNWMMLLPFVILVIFMFVYGVHPQPLFDYLLEIGKTV